MSFGKKKSRLSSQFCFFFFKKKRKKTQLKFGLKTLKLGPSSRNFSAVKQPFWLSPHSGRLLTNHWSFVICPLDVAISAPGTMKLRALSYSTFGWFVSHFAAWHGWYPVDIPWFFLIFQFGLHIPAFLTIDVIDIPCWLITSHCFVAAKQGDPHPPGSPKLLRSTNHPAHLVIRQAMTTSDFSTFPMVCEGEPLC